MCPRLLKFYQILKKLKKLHKTFKILPNVQNFVKSQHTDAPSRHLKVTSNIVSDKNEPKSGSCSLVRDGRVRGGLVAGPLLLAPWEDGVWPDQNGKKFSKDNVLIFRYDNPTCQIEYLKR